MNHNILMGRLDPDRLRLLDRIRKDGETNTEIVLHALDALAKERGVRMEIIDAETCNTALQLRTMADAIEPGFDPRAWLEARGL